jgi:FMN phosphatase YigB (HAD superfamily)
MLRLAIFDLDHTLIDTTAAFRLWAEEFAGAHGLAADEVEWLVAMGGDGYVMTRQELFETIRERYDVPGTVEALLGAYRLRMPDLVRCEQAVLDALASLRADGWRIAIGTNGEAGNQRGKAERTGLVDVVDGVCISGVVGVAKPDPEFFRLAAESAGCAIGDGGWMVGDNLPNDIAGGSAAGLRTVWIRGHAEDQVEDAEATQRELLQQQPECIVADVLEAISFLRGLERCRGSTADGAESADAAQAVSPPTPHPPSDAPSRQPCPDTC